MTILDTHHHDGTVSTSATAVGEGYNILSGTAPIYVASGFSNQALQWTSGAAAAYFQDNGQTNGYFFAAYIQFPTALPTSDLGFAVALDASSVTLASIVVNSSGGLEIHNALGSTPVDTSAVNLTVGPYYRCEWNVTASSTQELRLYTATGTTALDTMDGACTSGTAAKLRVGNPWTGKRGATGDTINIDEVSIADAWPNLGLADPWTYSKLARFGV